MNAIYAFIYILPNCHHYSSVNVGSGKGRPSTSASIKAFFDKRAKSLAEAEAKAADISDSDDLADSSSAPQLGGCLVNPVEAAGKALFGFEEGETLVLKFLGGDKEFKKYKNTIFKCTVVKYFAKKSDISRGRLVNPNGDIEMRVSWLDAPADFRVKGQPIIGKSMAFEHEGFIRDYEVVGHETPEMAG